ncbi:alkylated DNA repair protein (DNA oxidative demethylase) [Litoreibacter ponti]|uniref:Alkylated DNA repair protein (DNA oxidative demethylase) n=1 Tax=Litoreibacter ponti TaxID=1510457 RepID=A0A2T6BP85_9RHOB|nr:alpha-ketoglutarate-dependent dioxygenase AlkB [Litoreibacter ponti]PTX57898.1 alkylated DNA repair protein (DNA oxidative demethylase) [Litoreibacter ponti]
MFEGFLDQAAQRSLVEDIRRVVAHAPLFTPTTPSGKAMTVRMTSAGRVGWVTDHSGYRYEPAHPNGTAWPPIPDAVLEIWRAVGSKDRDPDSCLINFYGEDAKMGMHQDRDEGDFSWPVVSVSLGDEALFRIGNTTRGGKTESLWLRSGDVVVMGGEARLAYHGVDRVKHGSSLLLPKGGRINLTLRVVAD